MVTTRQPGPAAKLPAAQCAIAAANIRVLRQRNGWTQAHLGQLMGWPAASTVCAAEGHRGGRQRRFARWEIAQLAAIFGIPAVQLLTRCVTCGGQPPPGYACLTCGAGNPPPPHTRPGRLPGGPVSTRADGTTVTISALATLSAGTVRMTLTARDAPAPGLWQYKPQRRHRQPRRTRTHRRKPACGSPWRFTRGTWTGSP
jgi:hypothetical protein